MSYELIITEKPNASKKIAEALATGKPIKKSENGVPYYEITHGNKDIVIGCAVGHLFSIGEKEKSPWSKFPVFDVEWVPTADINKTSAFSRKYLKVLKKLAKGASEFTVACDYDIEGEVIGLNVVRKICKAKDAARMKFSTLTKDDLIEAYEHKSPTLDWGQANAGETRHILDFYYGINLTRALTNAINKETGSFKVLSSGRVQGPALKMIVEHEKKIRAFKPKPFWQIQLNGNIKSSAIEAMHHVDKFWKKEEADTVMKNVAGAKQGKISNTEKKQFKQAPPVPFDLTSMQIEVYRCFKIKPKETLDIAQNLYSSGAISYPRTSSQKLPQQIGYTKIFSQLKRQKIYSELADRMLAKKTLIPHEGKKTDEAHPAIYPTGLVPTEANERQMKVYDLIVKRFFSVFAEAATRETNKIKIDVNGEEFLTTGTVTIEPGWHEYYQPYVKLEEMELPIVSIGDVVAVEKIEQLSKETKPPNRYTQSSIINELEKKGLGTKATRASIVETLFSRGYVVGDSNIEATELGIQTVDTLDKHCPTILDEELTRKFEEEMEQIRKKKITPDQVLAKAKEVLNKIIKEFKSKEANIGKELSGANQEAIKIATTVGKCPKCKDGELVIKRGKFGKFIACNNYPDCKTIFNMPKTGTVKPTDKVCEVCGHPKIIVRLPKKSPQELCINPDCKTRQVEGQEMGKKYPEEGMTCPTCKKGKMVLRQSFYGYFLGCDNYPKCRTMMNIIDGKVNVAEPIVSKAKTSVRRKKAKKTTKKKTVAKKK